MLTPDKRLFFAVQVAAPWPEKLPVGRLLAEEQRHCTLAFLGQVSFSKLMDTLQASFPIPPFHIGFAGRFDTCLFLPERHPHVASWHIHWDEEVSPLVAYQKTLTSWLQSHGFPPHHSDRAFLPHVTLCRSPFDPHHWKKAFTPLPAITKDIHLFESLGHSQYQSLWHYPLIPPFEEIEHVADIAFRVRAHTLQGLHQHARTALAFRFPPLLAYFTEEGLRDDLDDIIIDLNELIGKADKDQGCPFKAVSFHGSVIKDANDILTWEMIVDV